MFRVLFFCGLVLTATSAPLENGDGLTNDLPSSIEENGSSNTPAAPLDNDNSQAKILSYENESDGKGNYKFSFETSNGIKREESGSIMNEGTSDQYIYVYGTITYIDPDGKEVTFRYAADQNGYEILPELQVPVRGRFFFLGSLMFTTIVTMPQAGCLEEQIKKIAFNTNGLGTYTFEYETTGGTYRREEGGMVPSSSGESLVVRGEYGYIDPGGRMFSLKYVADSNGFRPISSEDAIFNDRRII